MKKIQDKLVEIQNKEAGAGKNVSNKIIVLNFYSTDTPDLVVVDLPGATAVAVNG